jgi:hypothetical protein
VLVVPQVGVIRSTAAERSIAYTAPISLHSALNSLVIASQLAITIFVRAAFTIPLDDVKVRRKSTVLDAENLPSTAMAGIASKTKTDAPVDEGLPSCTMLLERFAPSTVLELGDIRKGDTKRGIVTIRNPSGKAKSLALDDKTIAEGFSIAPNVFGTSIEVAAKGEYSFSVTWSPAAFGNVRQVFKFSVTTDSDAASRSQKVSIIVFGTCVAAKVRTTCNFIPSVPFIIQNP